MKTIESISIWDNGIVQQATIEELKALIKPIEPIIPEATTEPIITTDNNLE